MTPWKWRSVSGLLPSLESLLIDDIPTQLRAQETFKLASNGLCIRVLGTLSVSLIVNQTSATEAECLISYVWKEPIRMRVRMVKALSSSPNLERWVFICSLMVNDRPCNRKAGIIFLAKTSWFGCRYCQGLRYESQDRNRKKLTAKLAAKSPLTLRRYLKKATTLAQKQAAMEAYSQLMRKRLRALGKRKGRWVE